MLECTEMSNTEVEEKAEKCAKLLTDYVVKIKEYYRAHGETNATLNKILNRLAELGYEESFLLTTLNHLNTIEETLLKKVNGFNKIQNLFKSENAMLRYQISVFFLAKMEKYSNSTLPFNINYVQPIQNVPLEAFWEPDKALVQKFKDDFKKFMVVLAEVISTNIKYIDNDEIQDLIVLRIIGKIGDDNFLYPLDIKVCLFKQQELARLGEGHFKLFEILPVIVLGDGKINDVKIYFGTTNRRILSRENKTIDLDNLPKKMPPYDLSSFREAEKYSCYAHYLESMVCFNEKCNLIDGIKSLGLDPYHIYSFNEEEDELISPEGFYIGALKNAAIENQQQESNEHLEEGNNFVQSGDILNALSAFDEALRSWPENYRVFECRGRMYANIQNKQFCDLKKAMLDFAEALKINPNAESAKKGLSDVYLCIAKKLKSKKKYTESKKTLQAALVLNKDNQKANVLLQKISKILSSNSSKSDDLELIALQKKR